MKSIAGDTAGHVVGKVIEHLPHAALGYGALTAKRKLLDQGPMAGPYNALKMRAMYGYYGGGGGGGGGQ